MENERTILTNSDIAKLPKWAVEKFIAVDRAKKEAERKLDILQHRNNFNTGTCLNVYDQEPLLLPDHEEISFNLAKQEPRGEYRVSVRKNHSGLLEVRGTMALQVYPRAANDLRIGLVGYAR